jgi:hypothetical protein
VCDGVEDARATAHAMLRDQPFGEASATIVLEERLIGIETSYIVLTDGERFVAMPTSQDHKRLGDGDTGPNTGGMGAYSPAPFVTEAIREAIEQHVIVPTLAELRRREIPFRGFLYAGIMLTADGPRVLEFNVRLGDPETQALMMALRGDLVPALVAAAEGALPADADLGPCDASAVVVLAAKGYPESPQKGAVIAGLDAAAKVEQSVVFHAGTALRGPDVVVAGGRVLGVTAVGVTPEAALAQAYRAVERIGWDGMQYRRDIGKALADIRFEPPNSPSSQAISLPNNPVGAEAGGAGTGNGEAASASTARGDDVSVASRSSSAASPSFAELALRAAAACSPSCALVLAMASGASGVSASGSPKLGTWMSVRSSSSTVGGLGTAAPVSPEIHS